MVGFKHVRSGVDSIMDFVTSAQVQRARNCLKNTAVVFFDIKYDNDEHAAILREMIKLGLRENK